MRILFVCNPLHGHLNPMLPLARAAQAHGHAAVVATGADLVAPAQRAGLSSWAVGLSHVQAGGNRQASWLDYFETGARARTIDLLPRCARWRPDLVVHDETDLSGPVVAATLGVPSVVHGLGPMPPARLAAWFAAAIERLAPAAIATAAVDAWRGSRYLQLCPPGLGTGEAPAWTAVLPLRPQTPDQAGDVALLRRIERLPHARTVFVTLGTVYNVNTAALAAAIEGLGGIAANLVVAVGPQADPAPFDNCGRQVLVAPLVPLDSVLARCCLVVSQGGSGVMLGAMAHGLPQLMLPQGADQFRNADLAVRSGAALALPPQEATPQAIGHGARRLLNERGFGDAAQGLAAQIAAMPDAEAVIATLAAGRGVAVTG